MLRIVTLLASMVLLLGGCAAVEDFGSSLKYNIQGEFYLQENKYAEGRETFLQAVQADPYNPEAHYYYGRFLLADNKARQALPYLEKAAGLNPKRGAYHFWLGVAYGEVGDQAQERQSYRQALAQDESHVQALTYLGNNLLKAGEYEEALALYQKAVELWHYTPQALYNRAVILRKLQRVPEERVAWLQYLRAYPAGAFARVATERLNSLDDHSFRNHRLGVRTVTLTDIGFVPFTAELAEYALPSLDLVGTVVNNMKSGVLQVVVYQLNNRELARKRALSIRNYIQESFPALKRHKRIRISWFDVAEQRNVLGRKVSVDESVRFFLTQAQ